VNIAKAKFMTYSAQKMNNSKTLFRVKKPLPVSGIFVSATIEAIRLSYAAGGYHIHLIASINEGEETGLIIFLKKASRKAKSGKNFVYSIIYTMTVKGLKSLKNC
jgi:hypothetical protein